MPHGVRAWLACPNGPRYRAPVGRRPGARPPVPAPGRAAVPHARRAPPRARPEDPRTRGAGPAPGPARCAVPYARGGPGPHARTARGAACREGVTPGPGSRSLRLDDLRCRAPAGHLGPGPAPGPDGPRAPGGPALGARMARGAANQGASPWPPGPGPRVDGPRCRTPRAPPRPPARPPRPSGPRNRMPAGRRSGAGVRVLILAALQEVGGVPGRLFRVLPVGPASSVPCAGRRRGSRVSGVPGCLDDAVRGGAGQRGSGSTSQRWPGEKRPGPVGGPPSRPPRTGPPGPPSGTGPPGLPPAWAPRPAPAWTPGPALARAPGSPPAWGLGPVPRHGPRGPAPGTEPPGPPPARAPRPAPGTGPPGPPPAPGRRVCPRHEPPGPSPARPRAGGVRGGVRRPGAWGGGA
ncbi:hypothetical protein OV450_0536 [Actinobacteria bacterium OV450]|nr:hypothetical protein OV450_0536 [Actinobacteria bacterium OV450]